MLAGEHWTQTKTSINIPSEKEYIKREVGDIWEEVSPDGSVVEWEQKKGYKVKRPKNLKILLDLKDTLYDFKNCYDSCEKRKTRNYSRYDKEVCTIHNMCLDCLSLFETNLKIQGQFEEYERLKKLNSLEDFFKEAEKEKEFLKKSLETIEYFNDDGTTEKWSIENKAAFLEKMDTDFEKLKDSLMNPLIKDTNSENLI